jgi:hypothetical protein
MGKNKEVWEDPGQDRAYEEEYSDIEYNTNFSTDWNECEVRYFTSSGQGISGEAVPGSLSCTGRCDQATYSIGIE